MKHTTTNKTTETATGSDHDVIDDLEPDAADHVLGGQSGLPTGVAPSTGGSSPGIVSPRDPASKV